MPSIIPRESEKSSCLLSLNGHTTEIPWEDVHQRFDIDGAIRIHAKDYAEFPEGKHFTHFNLQVSGHLPGHIYALPKIITPGFFISPDQEQPPLLDFSQCFIARCITVRENVMYTDLTDEDFAHSFRHIRNVDALKKEILWRYTQSLPTLSPEEILSLGVSITELEIIKKLD